MGSGLLRVCLSPSHVAVPQGQEGTWAHLLRELMGAMGPRDMSSVPGPQVSHPQSGGTVGPHCWEGWQEAVLGEEEEETGFRSLELPHRTCSQDRWDHSPLC